ncbi:MAG: PGN_0703 family putative restriction endonuclease [Actinomycetota bacterium]
MNRLEDIAKEHLVLVGTDSPFQRSARILQALWREDRGFPVGLHRDAPLGSRLEMPTAEVQLWNYLTPGIGAIVREEYESNRRVRDRSLKKMYGYPRLFNDLLSSQPMCFNLFGELKLDLELATRALAPLWPEIVGEVVGIEFEYSPGRGDPRYVENGSAADVFVQCRTPAKAPSFLAIETKYHENLRGRRPDWKDRYAVVSAASSAFASDIDALWMADWQLWLDHLLALSMMRQDGFEHGAFVLAYPSRNQACVDAADAYQQRLTSMGRATFSAVTIESLHEAIGAACPEAWVSEFERRYLDFHRIDTLIAP